MSLVRNMYNRLELFKKIVATLLGAILFLAFFMYGRIPSIVPTTYIHLAYGLSAFFGAVFGPFVSTVMVFLGHLTNDIFFYDICWTWIIGSTITGFFSGLPYYHFKLVEGNKINKYFYIWNIVGHSLAWLIVVPLLDYFLHHEPIETIIAECSVAYINNLISSIIIGGIFAFVLIQTKKIKSSFDNDNSTNI